MKKFLAILLAMMLVMVSVAAVATSGDDNQNGDDTPVTNDEQQQSETNTPKVNPTAPYPFTFEKDYEIIKNGNNIWLPADATLKFTATLDKITNSTLKKDDKEADPIRSFELSVEDYASVDVTNEDVHEFTLTGTLPQFPKVGVYTYKIHESGKNPAGVKYSADTYMKVVVLADVPNKPNDLKIGSVTIRTEPDYENEKTTSGGTKVNELINEYAAGSLLITKNVDGNLGDKTLPFEMTVEFTSEADVFGKMTITTTGNAKVTKIDDAEQSSVITEIAAGDNGWKTKKVTFELTDTDTIKFENVPATVSYKVNETKAGQEGYETTIEGSDMVKKEKAQASDQGTGKIEVVVTGEGEDTTKSVAADSITITNKKETTIDTGITLETLPYVLMMALAMMGLVALKLRKREEY